MTSFTAHATVFVFFMLFNFGVFWVIHKLLKRRPAAFGIVGAVYALMVITPGMRGIFQTRPLLIDLMGVVLAIAVLARAAVMSERLKERGEKRAAKATPRRRKAKVNKAKSQARANAQDAQSILASTKVTFSTGTATDETAAADITHPRNSLFSASSRVDDL